MSTLQRLLDYNSLHWISWLIAYRVTVTFHLPIWASLLIYLILLGGGVWAYRASGETSESTTPRWFVTGVLLLGVGLGSFTLFYSRPDSDDVSYMGDSRLETKNLTGRFSARSFGVVEVSEGALELYRAFPYESFVATTSNLVGIEPMQSYHNLAMIFLGLWWTVVYALMFRALGLSYHHTLVAIALAALFLLMDGNLHRTHGNFSFMRLWQGKVIMIAIVLPQILLGSLRFFQTPSRLNWLRLCAAVVIATEFSRSAIFLIPPLLVACAAAAKWSGTGAHWKTSITMLLAGLFPVALGLWIVLTGFLPSMLPNDRTPTVQDSRPELPAIETKWRDFLQAIQQRQQQVNIAQGFSLNWYTNIYDAGIGSDLILLRDLALLLLPVALIRRKEGKFLTLYNLIVIFLVAAPLTGPVVINLISTSGYWRVLFLLSLPLCFGLLVGVAQWPLFNRQGAVRWLASAGAVALCLGSFQQSILAGSNGTQPKKPWELRLPSGDVAVAQETQPILIGESVLAVEPLSSTFSVTLLGDIGALAYGNIRNLTHPWHFVNSLLQCHPDQRVSAAMIGYMVDELFGATHIFMRDCGSSADTDALIRRYLPGWQRVAQYGNYWLLGRTAVRPYGA